MKAKDLRERNDVDLKTLLASLEKDMFSYRMKGSTEQLEDTSLLKKTRRDLARIKTIMRARELEAAEGGKP